MTSPINLAIIGCGFISQIAHLPCFNSNSGFSIKYLADPFVDLRNDLARQYNIPSTCTSHLDICNDPDIEAVVVTLPRPLTFHVVQDLLKANKWILSEKPICINSEYGDKLLQTCSTSSSNVMTGYMKQHDLGVLEFKELITSIDSDEIISINAYCFMGNSYASPFGDFKGSQLEEIEYHRQTYPNWLPKDLRTSFEQFINCFSHITHLVDFIFDDSLDLQNSLISQTGEGQIICKISDIPVTFEFSRGNQYEWIRNQIYTLSLPPAFLRNVPAQVSISSGSNAMSTIKKLPSWSWAFREQTFAFEKFIKGDNQDIDDLKRAVQQVKLAELVYQSLIES